MKHIRLLHKCTSRRGGMQTTLRLGSPLLFKPIAFVEAQAAPAMALAGDDVEITIAVPIDDVGAGNHLGRFAFQNRDTFRIGEFGFGAGTDVAIPADAVLEVTADEIALAVAIPIDE